MEETLKILTEIRGGQSLITWLNQFGYNHGFGDDEVISLTFNRETGSALVLKSMKRDGQKRPARRVTFRLVHICDVRIDGFMHQNVIGGLTIQPWSRAEIHPSLMGIGGLHPDHRIIMEPCAGGSGTIDATISEIIVEPLPDETE